MEQHLFSLATGCFGTPPPRNRGCEAVTALPENCLRQRLSMFQLRSWSFYRPPFVFNKGIFAVTSYSCTNFVRVDSELFVVPDCLDPEASSKVQIKLWHIRNRYHARKG